LRTESREEGILHQLYPHEEEAVTMMADDLVHKPWRY
jgi:hypothetical protein